MSEFLCNDNINVESLDVLQMALEIFEKQNIDFVDSILCALNKVLNFEVTTFDKKLNRCINIK